MTPTKLILASLLVALLAACGGGGEEDELDKKHLQRCTLVPNQPDTCAQ